MATLTVGKGTLRHRFFDLFVDDRVLSLQIPALLVCTERVLVVQVFPVSKVRREDVIFFDYYLSNVADIGLLVWVDDHA